jgi:tRNA U34 2-thiouridine synthase MnmA/TrmU
VVRLDEAQFGIAVGQAAVIYDGANPNQLLGGGWIARAPLVANIDQNH